METSEDKDISAQIAHKTCKLLNSTVKYKGKFLSYIEKQYEIKDKDKISTYNWESVEYNMSHCKHAHFGISIIPIIKSTNEFVVIGNFRYPLGKFCLEFPAGMVDNKDVQKDGNVKEMIEKAGERELLRETGYIGHFKSYFTLPNVNNPVTFLTHVYSDPWKSNDTCVPCIFEIDSENSKVEKQNLDQCEIIKVFRVKKENLISFITDKLNQEDYVCSNQLYSLAMGLQFNNIYN